MQIEKPINGYDKYTITPTGECFSYYRNRKKKLKLSISEKGYLNAALFKDGAYKSIRVHRLVAESFIPNPENKPFVNHKDGNKKNNNVENLEWCTHSENLFHSYRVLGNKVNNNRTGKFGKDNPCSKAVVQKDLNGNIIQYFGAAIEICRKYGFDSGSLCRAIKNGKISYGYKWERVA